ncbi:MAG: Glu-tRNA(Gln) amidotransferase subunit GatE [Melioribacteraceae bacterium]|nr:Glu-tRNA(Gln) amidotransferase subunit GatE [Melioribacteraceae bacterium]MCF8353321.1 Glu-tRNA(Gln) amidotransferase subunit GatE [Melioribacteraceae bacterium]MCF8393185.1 Glu-tRNA(Gln) amidotransferase subunit GatE [Melioribacteraceae bacterium]MCF8419047.1 Glu-tRNA(Gln) amidotransferase subunit GatE [Melioribacteraceae bacterium]
MKDFIFKPFEQMTDEDYAEVGFKSGLEIHQQLLTDKKLFCRCPAGLYSDKYDAEILRHMRPTLSELGEYDGTALMEFKTKKNIIYRINRDTVCTYEMDDTPPFLINDQALDISIEIGLLYGCNIVDEIHITRKQYLDGSIPTGFQRTAVFAVDGKIPYKDREIEIVQLSIEEDSCREVNDTGHQRIYVADRLGMPLIETVTGPNMKTPVEVAEVGKILSNLVRSTHKVRRGIGAARQDVNVSVDGGTRIEIKGVPRLPMIPLLTYNEAMRQWNLLRLREELKRRGITPGTFEAESYDITGLIKHPNYLPLEKAVEQNLKIKCVVLKGFKDLLHWQTQTDTYFSKEISDRIRVIACLTTIPNLAHSDSKGDNLISSEWRLVKKTVGAGDDDTMVLVWGDEDDTDTAVKEIIIRAKEAATGIPSETRQALSDGTNGFERILPGADRMYPDTDLPPIMIAPERIKLIRMRVPELYWVREKWYAELGIPEDTRRPLAISQFAELFKQLVNEKNINPTLAAVTIIQFPKRLKRKGYDINLITEEMFSEIFDAYSLKLISRDGILPVLKKSLIRGKFYPEMLPKPRTKNEIDNIIRESIDAVNGLKINNDEKRKDIIMGEVMNRLRVSISGEEISRVLNNIL